MRKIICLILSVCLLLACNEPRTTLNFNRDWHYLQGDPEGAAGEGFDDTSWSEVGLPHSFSIPYFLSKDFYTGYGWYRKHFSLNKVEGFVGLEFDGVFQEAEVFINGKRAGYHAGGYTGFSVDISKFVREGDNLVAVRVCNLWRPRIAPRGGEHVFSGGIYRDVRLVEKNLAHIDWYGTFVTTPELADNKGEGSRVCVRTDIVNSGSKEGNFRLVSRILNPKGKEIAQTEQDFTVEPGGKKTIEQNTDTVRGPELWGPKSPALYTLESLLYQGSKLIDKETTGFGFRYFEWTADNGFFLNGEHYPIHGANVHQDQAGWGDAVTRAATGRDVQMIKDAGMNFIRGSHYPHSPAFSDACDRTGILLWSEAPFWATAGPKVDGYWTASAYPIVEEDIPGFEGSILQQLEEMIRIHRNHPSIVAWSMCNEPFFTAPGTMDGVRDLLQKLVARSHELDPTRPAATGGVQRPLGDERIDKYGDIAGYNGDGGTIADFLNPGIPNIVSEYGSKAEDRPGQYDPNWGDLSRGDSWKGFEWRSGQSLWCAFDHGSIFGSGMAKMGMVDYFRIPKRAWYWYREHNLGIAPPQWPTDGKASKIRLEASKYKDIATDGTDDAFILITMLDASGQEVTDCPTVELRVVSGPGEFPTGSSITFSRDSDISILDGKTGIAIRSYQSGTCIVEARAEGMEPTRIKLQFTGGPAFKAKGAKPLERPYVRYISSASESLQSFGHDNPTFASSSAEGHLGGYATDGKPETFWSPSPDDSAATWTLDTERSLVPSEVHIHFLSEDSYLYLVESSADNSTWTTLSENKASLKDETTKLPDGSRPMRFLRLRFLPGSATPRLSEVEILGRITR